MYSKTRLGSDQIEGALLAHAARQADRLPRGRPSWSRPCAAVGVWSAVSHDQLRHLGERVRERDRRRARPAAGSLHYCGAQAKSFCRAAFANADPISLAAQPQCDLAGLTKAKVAAG